jgi:hypothetical protein
MRSAIRFRSDGSDPTQFLVLNGRRQVLIEATFEGLTKSRCKLHFRADHAVRIWRLELYTPEQPLFFPTYEPRKGAGWLSLERKANEGVVAVKAGEDDRIDFHVERVGLEGVDLRISYPSALIACSRADYDRFFPQQVDRRAWEI